MLHAAELMFLVFYRFGSPFFMIDYNTRPAPVNCDEIMYDTQDYPEMEKKILNVST